MKKVFVVALIALSLTIVNIQEINTYKTEGTKVLTIEDTINSFKPEITLKVIC
ncbi:hypothetical protein [Clostridium formicaceticum]|uniref:Uncharacterized protein n=1 Tax=Clostridium formicaceticum TaxID=1497 RepID=A0AAC9RGD3_9CLOT|nr:hypothetical protein [Clostridium formicaceticum]ARE86346.1 hypothetical protein CLFO_06680 [Clostridium formicaceticum]